MYKLLEKKQTEIQTALQTTKDEEYKQLLETELKVTDAQLKALKAGTKKQDSITDLYEYLVKKGEAEVLDAKASMKIFDYYYEKSKKPEHKDFLLEKVENLAKEWTDKKLEVDRAEITLGISEADGETGDEHDEKYAEYVDAKAAYILLSHEIMDITGAIRSHNKEDCGVKTPNGFLRNREKFPEFIKELEQELQEHKEILQKIQQNNKKETEDKESDNPETKGPKTTDTKPNTTKKFRKELLNQATAVYKVAYADGKWDAEEIIWNFKGGGRRVLNILEHLYKALEKKETEIRTELETAENKEYKELLEAELKAIGARLKLMECDVHPELTTVTERHLNKEADRLDTEAAFKRLAYYQNEPQKNIETQLEELADRLELKQIEEEEAELNWQEVKNLSNESSFIAIDELEKYKKAKAELALVSHEVMDIAAAVLGGFKTKSGTFRNRDKFEAEIEKKKELQSRFSESGPDRERLKEALNKIILQTAQIWVDEYQKITLTEDEYESRKKQYNEGDKEIFKNYVLKQYLNRPEEDEIAVIKLLNEAQKYDLDKKQQRTFLRITLWPDEIGRLTDEETKILEQKIEQSEILIKSKEASKFPSGLEESKAELERLKTILEQKGPNAKEEAGKNKLKEFLTTSFPKMISDLGTDYAEYLKKNAGKVPKIKKPLENPIKQIENPVADGKQAQDAQKPNDETQVKFPHKNHDGKLLVLYGTGAGAAAGYYLYRRRKDLIMLKNRFFKTDKHDEENKAAQVDNIDDDENKATKLNNLDDTVTK
jgi:hypothetical protein